MLFDSQKHVQRFEVSENIVMNAVECFWVYVLWQEVNEQFDIRCTELKLGHAQSKSSCFIFALLNKFRKDFGLVGIGLLPWFCTCIYLSLFMNDTSRPNKENLLKSLSHSLKASHGCAGPEVITNRCKLKV